jgi:hypothetical protein
MIGYYDAGISDLHMSTQSRTNELLTTSEFVHQYLISLTLCKC